MRFFDRNARLFDWLIKPLWVIGLVGSAVTATADSINLAPGFSNIKKDAAIVVMRPDVELFSISAGGVIEAKADWTETALKNIQQHLSRQTQKWGLRIKELSEDETDQLAEVQALHAAVARAISFHHLGTSATQLPTKSGRLDWSLDQAIAPIRKKSDSDYALFIWMRDSYASAERKATMLAFALLGVAVPGGVQTGYASLVDLRTGQVVWFNQLRRAHGDLRESESAQETVLALLANFPHVR